MASESGLCAPVRVELQESEVKLSGKISKKPSSS